MRIQINVLRMDRQERKQYMQSIPYDSEDEAVTVAAALGEINADPKARDVEGNAVSPILWECSCLQKKCGACAMRVNGHPRLACDVRLAEFSEGQVTLEPLLKFPVVADLIVDRSVLYENLKQIGVWLEGEALHNQECGDMAYEASRCLQCGCCLEVCPNFCAGGTFAGMAGFVPTARLLSELPREQRKKIADAYRKRIYEGCGKSLACRNICPAGIDIEGLLVRSNAMAIWKRGGW